MLFLFLIFSFCTSALEEAYVEMKAKNLRDTFFMIQYDYENDIPYVGVEALKDFLELKTLELDKKNRVLKGKFSEDEEYAQIAIPKILEETPEDDIYLTLEEISKIFKIREYRWESDSLKIELMVDYKLTYELVKEAEQRIKKLENQKDSEEKYIDVYGEKRFFAPGILKLDYNNYNLRDGENYFQIEYGTQLFYGDFYISQDLVPKQKLRSVNLEYREFLGKKGTLLLGDTYLQKADYYSVERNIKGISYNKDDVYAFSKNNEIFISGRVIGARLVELLQNNSLLDYVRLNNEENYSFSVKNSSAFGKYSVKIYYEDGRIESKDINVLSSSLLLPQGESDYSFQIGEGEEDKKVQQQYNYRYGVHRNLTLGGGLLKGSDGEETIESLEGDIILRVPLSFLPTVFDIKVLKEKKDSRANYIFKMDQKIGELGFFAEYQDFSGNLAEEEGYEKYYNFQLNRGFGNFNLSLGGEREVKDSDYLDTYSANIGYSGFKNLSLYIYNEYEKPKELDGFYSLEFKGAYSGLNYASIIAEAKQRFISGENVDSEYALKINRKIGRESSFRDLDLSAEINYRERRGTTWGVSFTWYFDKDSIYVETPIDHRNGELEVGLRVQKAFILEDPLAKVNPKNVNDTWIEGVVFLDIDGDEIQSEDEEVLENVEVRIGTETRVTDSKGGYKITDLSGKSLHTVELVGSSLDAMVEPKYEFRTVKPVSSTGVKVDIPVSPVSLISGEIKILNSNEKEIFRILSRSTIFLKKGEKIIKKVTPEFDGYYYIEGVLPGEYQLEVEYRGDIDVKIENSFYNLDIKPGKEGEYYENNDFVLDKILEEGIEVEEDEKNS